MQRTTYIGLDIGRSAVKAKVFADSHYWDLIFPSVVSLAIPISDEGAARKAEAETVEVGGKLYFTGDTARLQGGASSSTGLSNDWIESPEYQALVLSAMKRLKAKGVPGLDDNPIIVVGTPAAQYRVQRERLEKVTRATVNAEVKAVSQPMGAYLSWVCNEMGIPVRDKMQDGAGRKRSWAVVEVGHFSTDFLLIKEGEYIESKSQSCEGVYLAAENLVRILADKRQMEVTPLVCEQALRTKTVLHFGEKRINEEVDEAVEFVVNKIMAKANFLFSEEVARLDGILIAGGGAPVVHPSIHKKWGNSAIVPNPRMAVADGFLRHARSLGVRRASLAAQQLKAQAQ